MNKSSIHCSHVPNVGLGYKPVAALLRVALLAIAALLILMPVSGPVTSSPDIVSEPVLVNETFSEASNFIRMSLPYPVKSIAVGTTSQGSGIAYVHGDLLRFKNPVSLADDSVFIGTETVLHRTLTSADMDGDGHSEFLIMKFGLLPASCLVVDFDNHSSKEFSCPVADPIEILTGDFDGNGVTDFAVYNVGSLVIMNMTDGSLMLSYNFLGDVVRACVGNFTLNPGDEIAVLYNAVFGLAVMTFSGLGPIGSDSMGLVVGCDIATFHYGAGFDDIAVTFVDATGTGDPSYLKTYYGDLTEIYTVGNPSSTGAAFVKTGYFNGDSQEDLAVLSRTRALAWFADGNDGSTVRTSVEEYYGANWRAFATAILDSDNYTDVAVEGPRSQLSLIRGVNGETGYEEPRSPGPFAQVLTYDIDSDGRSDIVALTDQITILLSDIQAPSVSLEPLYPAHPTFYDSYVKIELTATDELEVRGAIIYIKPAGAILTMTYQAHEMVKAPNGRYLFIMAGLQPSDFDYYIEVTDPYLNTYSYGNESNPNTLTVEGHFAWGHFFNTTIEQGQTHALALGNNSAGEQLLLAMTLEPTLGTATLRVFSTQGTEVTQAEILSSSRDFKFEVYSGMLDADNILDPVVVGYNATHTRLWVLHGNNMTFWRSDMQSVPSTTMNNGLLVFDDDEDQTDEIHYVGTNVTAYFLMRADDGFSSWVNATLPGNSSIVGAACASIYALRPQIGVLRGDKKLDIYQAYNVTWLRTLDYSSPGSTPNDLPMMITTYHNSSRPTDQFLTVYGGWVLDTPVTYMCLVGSETSTVGDDSSHTILGRHLSMVALYDMDTDYTDELLFFDNVGNVSLFDFSYAEIRRWTVFVSEAGPLSSALLDYDGDGSDEFLISTSDDKLTAIGLGGVQDYQAAAGMLFNMINIGNVDPGLGEDLAAFPILRARSTLGAVRNIELFYVLEVGFGLESSVILQGTNLWANTTVLNVFHEPVSDAFVSLTAQYRYGAGISEQSLGSIYDNSSHRYSSIISPNWPIGMVNMSLAISHEYYDSYSASFVNALKVVSPLTVSLFADSQVQQGEDLPVNASVTDSLGGRVTDAEVNVTLDGIMYPAYYNEEFYHVILTNITLAPGNHNLAASADHPYSVGIANRARTFSVFASALIIVRNSPSLVEQHSSFAIELSIADLYGHPIVGASVMIDFGILKIPMSQTGPGLYLLNHTADMPVGNYTCEVQVNHPFIEAGSFDSFSIGVIGNLNPVVRYEGSVEQGSFFNVSVFVYDGYGTTPAGANVTIEAGGFIYRANSSGSAEFKATVLADFPIGPNSFTVFVQATFGHMTSVSCGIETRSRAVATVLTPVLGGSYVQGDDDIAFALDVADSLGNAVTQAYVRILISETTYMLTDHLNGTYTAIVTTSGWAPGNYSYVVFLTRDFLDYTDPIGGNVTIQGKITLDITLSTSSPEQNTTVTVTVRVADWYAHSISGAYVTLEFGGTTRVVPETSTPGLYEMEVDVGFIPHGQHNLTLCAEHLLCKRANSTLLLQVTVKAPQIAMNTQTFMFGSGLSFLVSFVGLLIYFRISSSLAVVDVSSKAMVKSIRRMDVLYGAIVGLGGLTLVHSYVSAQAGDFGLALGESVLLLGISVLLYGIWLYRDANYAIIQAKKLSKKRMIAGLWHLIFVPLVIAQIFVWGGRIEWFQYWVLESTFNLGSVAIPMIMLTIFATYVSSIGIVVVNLYREIRNSLTRLERMAGAGTPPAVVAEERLQLVGRLGSSIRIKFFMFLVILAGTTVMTMEFLRSYSLGVIVLMPVVFLILIPYVSSKMLKGASRVSGKMRERRPTAGPSLTEVADSVTEVSGRVEKESYEPPDKAVSGTDMDWKPGEESDEEK